ncbi:MAG: type II toxin-antitoxin system VapC family toxin [Planctomycetia bacterium]|nr:type II toxin-antitoxin system VapC family toxin [Planctomycetia bacterium]
MRHLLDTHTLLWYTLSDPRLSGTAKTLILDSSNEILISPASYWEIAIKICIGKLVLNQPYDDFIDVCLNQYGFVILPVEPKHTAVLTTLPLHHRDPFDWLIIAQAMVEDISVISSDDDFDAYPVRRLW